MVLLVLGVVDDEAAVARRDRGWRLTRCVARNLSVYGGVHSGSVVIVEASAQLSLNNQVCERLLRC